ncbi:MAG: prepilin peptidase [Deltaproteobacteria bacterium]|nr:prepilin peptidase [Deltaproteobacteria bacterium]MBW1912424.1 prepilin peptidase [Deltaproteobacteria bacterium]
MALNSTMTVFSFLFGMILGSFLNVCIYRVPRKRSIVNPPSSCPQCGEGIRFYDNIPVISYIMLMGRCRNCRQSIPVQYPLVELIAGLLSLSLFTRYGLSSSYPLYLLFSLSLVVISFIDLQHKIIPDVISLPGIVCGLAASIIFGQISWLDSLIGIIAGGGVLYLIAVIFERMTGKVGMGGGDIKLLAMIGAWMGWPALPFVVLISSLTGVIIGSVSLLLSRKGLRTRIPFGPFLAIGALAYLFFGRELVSWYFRLLM